MSRASNDALDKLHEALAAELADRLVNGEEVVTKGPEGDPVVTRVKASAATLGQIRQFLKDNHIESTATSPRIRSIIEGLPFAGDPEDGERALTPEPAPNLRVVQ